MVILAILYVYAIYLAAKNETGFGRITWILIILLFPFIGAGIYLVVHYVNNRK